MPHGSGKLLEACRELQPTATIVGVLHGEVMLQSLASYVAALVLGSAPGARVLDMCAAPGGKATALAQLMGDCGEVVALDRSHRKVSNFVCPLK